MAERTNLISKDNPGKYILGSVLLLITSGIGIFWLVQNKNMNKISEKNVPETIVSVTPTETISKAKEGESCGAGPKGVVQCETGLVCNESKNTIDFDDLEETKTGAGGICEKAEEASSEAKAETITTKVTPTLKLTPTMAKIASATPTLKVFEIFESKDDGFKVRYDGARKFYQENEASGIRYVFYSYAGNITVHVGTKWSWLNPGRTFTDTLLIDGEKSFVYEISNQKIVDIEKGDKKYSIQCVHNASKVLKAECDKFLEDFKFI